VTHAGGHSTSEAESGGSRIQAYSGLYSRFQVSQGYIVIPCLKNSNALIYSIIV
jgi:hypothetical protein